MGTSIIWIQSWQLGHRLIFNIMNIYIHTLIRASLTKEELCGSPSLFPNGGGGGTRKLTRLYGPRHGWTLWRKIPTLDTRKYICTVDDMIYIAPVSLRTYIMLHYIFRSFTLKSTDALHSSIVLPWFNFSLSSHMMCRWGCTARCTWRWHGHPKQTTPLQGRVQIKKGNNKQNINYYELHICGKN